MGKSVNRWLYKDSKYSYQLKDLTSRKSIHEIKESLKGMGLYGGHTIMSHCGVPIDGLRHRLWEVSMLNPLMICNNACDIFSLLLHVVVTVLFKKSYIFYL